MLAQRHPSEYERTVKEQVAVCQRIFVRPISVLSGAAGTGKTTLVKSIIDGIERGHGAGTSFLLLAPTGKAADRLRERTKKEAMTIHSFLARLGWLNDNGTYKRSGQREQSITTFIIDESSMLDLELLATFCRAVNWNAVQRLIFVGDPSQLPPIGTGRVFADLIDWLRDEGLYESIAELTINMRQIENRLNKTGTGILDLASIFVHRRLAEQKSADLDAQEEQMLERLQEGGDVDQDLRVLYWQDPEDLERQLISRIVSDMEQDTGEKLDPSATYKLWDALMMPKGKSGNPEASQVISPYRGELFGVDYLNLVLQQHKNNRIFQHKGSLGGITYFDKVIQVVNRPKSNPIWAYNLQLGKNERIQVFNGEIGFTRPHKQDNWQGYRFRLGRFNVTFSQRQHLWVGYGSEEEVISNLELAYAISVHKSQGSEFGRVYFVLPKHKRALLSRELFYTGITRAKTHCTLLIEEDIAPILSLRRPESAQLDRINSSLFAFRPAPAELQTMWQWYEEGKIHRTLTGHMVRSKSEVIIANLLHAYDIPFEYEVPLPASDGTFYLPDFTIKVRGETWYWEHWGMLHDQKYRSHREKKLEWYKQHGFADRLIETEERTGFDSTEALKLMRNCLGIA
ncbi:MAG: AAA family ATPase [Oscillochloridaceae bacterium umkhey_bin13]